jgi:hypothetical protein
MNRASSHASAMEMAVRPLDVVLQGSALAANSISLGTSWNAGPHGPPRFTNRNGDLMGFNGGLMGLNGI